LSKFPLILDPEQEKSVRRLAAEPSRASLNVSGTGRGKTVIAVELAKRIEAKTILIVAPKNTRTGWMVHFRGQGVDLPFSYIDSSKNGKEAYGNLMWQVPGIYFVGTEMFARMGSEAYVGKDGKKRRRTNGVWEHVSVDLVLMDESHRASNARTATYFALDLLQRVGYKHCMSATPTGNSFEGAYTTAKWLWPDHPSVANGFSFWKGRYCIGIYDHFKWDHLKTTGERNPGEFYSGLPCVVKLEQKPIPIIEDTVYVELTTKQRKQTTELEKNLLTWMGENPYAIEFPTTLHTRLKQVSLGEISLDDDGEVTFARDCKSAKIDAMWDVLLDDFEDEPALIGVGNSKKFVKVVVDRLNEKWPGSTVEWSGDVAEGNRDRIKEDWIAGKVKYVVAVIESLAEGADLMQTATRNLLWFNKSPSGILNTQFLGRIRRQGVEGVVRSVVLEAIDTKDQDSYKSLADEEMERRRSLMITKEM
jgi:DNA or RNA helicases of superfamily II